MTSPDRLKGAAAALLVQGLLGWLLVSGLTASWRRAPEEVLTVFRVAPPPPPPPAKRIERSEPTRNKPGEPSPPNLRSTATPVLAPPPLIPPPLPPPVVTALEPSTGAQATTGAALMAGPGAGAGGVGDGMGAGGGTLASPPRQIRGQIGNADYPSAAARQGRSGGVDIRYLVGADGRVGTCRIVQSSGSADLDATACRLAQARFRFKPARDANGRKVPAWLDDGVEWVNHQPPSAPPPS